MGSSRQKPISALLEYNIAHTVLRRGNHVVCYDASRQLKTTALSKGLFQLFSHCHISVPFKIKLEYVQNDLLLDVSTAGKVSFRFGRRHNVGDPVFRT